MALSDPSKLPVLGTTATTSSSTKKDGATKPYYYQRDDTGWGQDPADAASEAAKRAADADAVWLSAGDDGGVADGALSQVWSGGDGGSAANGIATENAWNEASHGEAKSTWEGDGWKAGTASVAGKSEAAPREAETFGEGWDVPSAQLRQQVQWGAGGDAAASQNVAQALRHGSNENHHNLRPPRREQYSRPPIEELMGGKRQIPTDDDLEKRMARIKKQNEAIRRKKMLVEEDERKYKSHEVAEEPTPPGANDEERKTKQTSAQAIWEELKAERERNAGRKRQQMLRLSAVDETIWAQTPIEEDDDYLISRFGQLMFRSPPVKFDAPQRGRLGADRGWKNERKREVEEDWPALKTAHYQQLHGEEYRTNLEHAGEQKGADATSVVSDTTEERKFATTPEVEPEEEGEERTTEGAAVEAEDEDVVAIAAHDRIAAESEGSESGEESESDKSDTSTTDSSVDESSSGTSDDEEEEEDSSSNVGNESSSGRDENSAASEDDGNVEPANTPLARPASLPSRKATERDVESAR